ncbi:hypothetical protein M408DRAFT_270242 [Serendipita vermifera MAFF 305830]|uniref:Uncharacterized protein n=1 Tax=Serendipita vermifera MAFF 305830 TaxID=933852 RepID=A0A0C2XP89_SERVB|nr:hypothetical protein M408DRAFT_270242 [Serendipita vermifera MAFF 305830]
MTLFTTTEVLVLSIPLPSLFLNLGNRCLPRMIILLMALVAHLSSPLAGSDSVLFMSCSLTSHFPRLAFFHLWTHSSPLQPQPPSRPSTRQTLLFFLQFTCIAFYSLCPLFLS